MLPLIKDIKLGTKMHQEFKSKTAFEEWRVNPLEGVSDTESWGILLRNSATHVEVVTCYREKYNFHGKS